MKKIKKLLFVFCLLLLSGCTKIEYLCEYKDPNEMTEREFELCKAYLSHSETIITNNNNTGKKVKE